MAATTISFTKPLNVSVQIGDDAFYSPTGTTGDFTTSNTIVEIGPIKAINNPQSNNPTIVCDPSLLPVANLVGQFIFFSKDNRANMSSLLGYYNEVVFKSNYAGTSPEELFNVGMDAFVSSK